MRADAAPVSAVAPAVVSQAFRRVYDSAGMNIPEPLAGQVRVNQVALAYLDWGGSGGPIIVLHATGLLGRVYRPIIEALRSVGHVYSYDQRGHGDSGPAPAPDGYDWTITMQDLAGFIRTMGFKSVRAFGHSAGGTAIGSLATEQPELISRAVLVEPVLFEQTSGPVWGNPLYERTLKRRREFDSVDAMFANFDTKPPYDLWRKDILRDYCEFGTWPTSAGMRVLKCAPETEARIYQTSRDFDGLSRVLRAEQPMLIVFGERGNLFGSHLADRIAAERKHGRVMNVPRAGHFLPMEQPHLIAELASEFLA